MCGICGIIDYSANKKISEGLLYKMCAALKHRGPDDEGIYVDLKNEPAVGLGHRRLKIIDLSEVAHQPMSNEDKTVWLVFNGEIYNYKELRSDLEKKGHIFKSNSDAETVVHLYEEYGRECVKSLRGMFAFAVWDTKREILFLARDRIGKKPLLYAYTNGIFCFASEFASLLASNLVNTEISLGAIDPFLIFGYIPAPLTIYKHIFKLPPAHTLVLDADNLRIEKYWELAYVPKIRLSEQEATEEVLRLLKEAIKIRLYSDVPLGAFLSGGVDSSTVVALMSELSSSRVKTFSIGFAEKDYSELKYARNIAQRFVTEHHEFIVKPKALEILPLLVERYGEPYADSSCIPTYYVCQQTRQHVTVALSGDGGDECFAGYERYQAMLAARIYQKFPGISQKMICGIFRNLPDSVNPKNRIRNIKRFFQAINLPDQQRYLHWISIFNTGLRAFLYSEDFKNRVPGKDPLSWLLPYFNDSQHLDLLDRLLMVDIHTSLPNDFLVKVDIACMANSLEGRSPFLDHKFMEFTAKLPAEYKMKRFIKKYLLKKAIKDLVPAGNINRRKMGFGVPVGEWFRNDLKGFLCETLLSESFFKRRYFNPEAVKNMVKQHIERKTDYTFQLWALLMLELWHKRFAD